MAAVEWACGTGLAVWLGRERIGRRLAQWWARHYGPHAVEHHRRAAGL